MCIKKYFPGPAAFFSAGPDNYILYNFKTKQLASISRDYAYKYSDLSGIKSDELHIKELISVKDPSWKIDDYEKLISFLKKEELLSSLPDFGEDEIRKNNFNSEIALITSERPELFYFAIESIAEGIYKNHPDINITVFDDSNDKEIETKNKQITADIESKYSLKTTYFGRKEKKLYRNELCIEIGKKDIEKNILDYAFFGNHEFSFLNGPGGNRNTSILKYAGSTIISFDDDIRYQFGTSPGPKNSIEISSSKDPDKDIFENPNKAERKFNYSNLEAIGYIKDILGENVNTLIKKAEISGGSIYAEDFRAEPGFSLKYGENTVKAAIFGIYGGKWYSSPFGTYFYGGTERNKAFKKKSEYENIKKNPFSLMLPKDLTLSRAPFFVATAMGIDASEIIPPFPPCGRNEDGIWAAVMIALNKKSFISHLPFAIYHETKNKLIFTEKDYEDTSAGFGIITVLIVEQIKKNLLTLFPEITYEIFGSQLSRLSQLSDKQFTYFCHDLWLEYAGNSISRLENLLIKYRRKPKHWAKDVDNYIYLLENQSLLPENALPKEFRENYSNDQTIKLYKLFFKEYGELLIKWPAIWKEAYKLNTGKEKLI